MSTKEHGTRETLLGTRSMSQLDGYKAQIPPQMLINLSSRLMIIMNKH